MHTSTLSHPLTDTGMSVYLEDRHAELGGRVGHGDAGAHQRLDLVLRTALAASNDRTCMACAKRQQRERESACVCVCVCV
jgi:hypothetical protein